MSKSEKSLQKPLKLAVSNLPSSQERNPSMTELKSGVNQQEKADGGEKSNQSKTNTSLREQSTVSHI